MSKWFSIKRGFFSGRYAGYLALAAALLLHVLFPSSPLAAFPEDMETLGMYYEANDLVVSATRNPKPLSQAAENITVITANEIEMMGAHTLVDVLATVPGIQISDRGGPGLFNEFLIQDANVNHILVLVDGVTLNFIGTPIVDVTGIPIQNIERIEIVKGPGSSSWGSALGAVVNIVTKAPLDGKKLGGSLSFSGGERGTRDSRAEFSGTIGRFGYYLYAGNLTSGGLRPGAEVDQNDLYAKLRWDFPERGSIQFTAAYDRGIAGEGDTLPYSGYLYKYRRRYLFSTLSFNYPLTDSIDLDLSLRTTYKKARDFAVNDASQDQEDRESSNGWSAKLTWRQGFNTLAAGADYDNLNINFRPYFQRYSDKYGVFLNDTLVLGDFALTPGIRYDRMRPVGDFYSPSLGAAWNPTDKITIRAYGARGYSLPLLCPVKNANATQAKVTTVQAGVETTYIPHLWLKATYFWNQLADVQQRDPMNWRNYVLNKQLKQGVEVEGKTVPIFNTSLSAGYTFIEAKDRDTGQVIKNAPSQIVKIGVHYDDMQHSFRGALLGRYVWYNADSDLNTRDKAFIWDLNLAKKVLDYRGTDLELFFNVHNIFNGAQYLEEDLKNPRRWVEGGIKFNF